jgi:hypothetical protein
MPSRRCAGALLALLLLTAPTAGRAQPALLSDPTLAFPGAYPTPPNAVSAARGYADAWLGATPWSNPAVPTTAWSAELSLFALHIGRQDLRADNRNYDEVSVFLGGGGVALVAPIGARMALHAYAWRPESRMEENTYTVGDGTDPTVTPATVTNRVEVHESRAGAGIAATFGDLRAGAAIELTARDDFYRRIEQSGSPVAGTRELAFDGTAVGGQAGLHWGHGASPKGRIEIGAAVRLLPELEVSGEEVDDLAIGTTTTPASAIRESGWEGGLSAAYGVGEAVRLLAGFGGRTAQAWEGFGVEAGVATHWSVAADVHDARDPWSLHIGFGRGTQDGVPEPSCSVFGLGGDWDFGSVTASAAVIRRGLQREGKPTSHDDRFYGGLRADW